jgi:hypothetical protein
MSTDIRTPHGIATADVPAPRSPLTGPATTEPSTGPSRGAARRPSSRAVLTVAVIAGLITLGGGAALVLAFTAVTGATVASVDGTVDGAVDSGGASVNEFDGGPIRFGEGPSGVSHDKAAVDAGGVPDFSDDIAVGPYTGGDFGGSVEVTVTNTGDLPFTYTATVAATSPDGSVRYGTTVVVVDDVAAGGTAARQAVFLSEIPADAVFVLVDYSRWSF